jgi:hypothetical protein
MTEYQSFERKYLGGDKPLGGFLIESGKTLGGWMIGVHTLPTRARKVWNGQTRLQREEYEGKLSKITGAAIGNILGVVYSIAYYHQLSQSLSQGDYLPAAVLGVPNILSFVYELGRKKESASDRKERKLEKLAKKMEKVHKISD